MSIKYPNIKVKLEGTDGNAFAVMGLVSRELKKNGVKAEEIKQFTDECTSGDYNHLLQTCVKWVDCFGEDEQEDDDYCPDCGETWDNCDCEDDYEECFDCGERLDECTCDDEDND